MAERPIDAGGHFRMAEAPARTPEPEPEIIPSACRFRGASFDDLVEAGIEGRDEARRITPPGT
jgi:hypothetical protein